MDDVDSIRKMIGISSAIVKSRYTLRCAYTPLVEVTLLHVCAEFNHLSCAIELVAAGADVNAKAGLDTHGFGGQTPIFHAVNQNNNLSADMMDFLLSKDVDLMTSVTGLVWGRGYDWETFIPAVNPISYAMMGLLPQMHRDERTISRIVSTLLKRAYGLDYTAANVPNKYLQ
jgi:ankyrin repeat protein